MGQQGSTDTPKTANTRAKTQIPGWDEMGVELMDGTDGIPLMTRFDEGLSCDGTSTMSGGLQLKTEAAAR